MRYFFFIIVFLFTVFPLFGQQTETAIIIDSLEQVLKSAPSQNRQKVDLLNDLGYRYWIINSNESLTYGKRALELAQELDYAEGAALAKRVLGVSYWTLGKPKLALENLTSAQQDYMNIDNPEGAANCLMNSGMVYADIGDYEKALSIYDKSIERFTKLNLNRRIATTFTKIGYVYLQQKELGKAKEYLTNAINMHSRDNYVYGMAEAHNYLGAVLMDLGELEQADHHLRRAVELGKEVNDEDGFIGNLIKFGKLQRLQGDYKDAESHLLEGLEKAKSKQLRKYELAAYQELRLLKKEQGLLNESLEYYDTFIALKDSIYSADKSKQIAAMEFGQELETKEKEIALLHERERTNTIINWSVGLGAIGALIIGFLLFNNQRLRRIKGQELLASKEELAKTALENAHLKQNELQQKIEFKNKELTSYTLNFVQKNELLQQLHDKINSARGATPAVQVKLLKDLERTIRQQVNIDKDWEDFKRFFEEVHTDFHKTLKEKHPDLSPNDLKICSLTRLNLNVKETANILGISPESAKTARYRLRKKLNLQPEEELLDYFLSLEK